MAPGETIRGPALIEMVGMTCVVIDPYEARLDADRNLVPTRAA